jgi:hypothetical protein
LMVRTGYDRFPLRVFPDFESLTAWIDSNIINDKYLAMELMSAMAMQLQLGLDFPESIEVWHYIDSEYKGHNTLLTFNIPEGGDDDDDDDTMRELHGGPFNKHQMKEPKCGCDCCSSYKCEGGEYRFDNDRSIWVWRPLINPELN